MIRAHIRSQEDWSSILPSLVLSASQYPRMTLKPLAVAASIAPWYDVQNGPFTDVGLTGRRTVLAPSWENPPMIARDLA